ncbi:MAG: hypothetical protein ACYDCQ_11315 [Dehalococcoidia bacterium]
MDSEFGGELLSGAVAVIALIAALAIIFRLATGLSPWPVFLLAELPGAGFGFILLALSSPRRR